jgi:hypothetical protein
MVVVARYSHGINSPTKAEILPRRRELEPTGAFYARHNFQTTLDTPSPNYLIQIIKLSAFHLPIYEAQDHLFHRYSLGICGEWVASSQPLDSSD